MAIMKGNHSALWHRQVGTATTRQSPTDARPEGAQYFPFTQLQGYTDSYLKKKGKLTLGERDTRLITLVRGHPTKDVAIIACAHALSPWAVRDLLHRELQVDPHSCLGALQYLHAIVAANHANPDAVMGVEAQCAQTLISLLSHDILTFGEHIQVLANRMTVLRK